jgi:hypothetical protein
MAKSLAWYVAKGAPYNLDDLNAAHYAYMKAKSGLADGDVKTHERAVMTALGFTDPNLQDAKRKFYASKLTLAATLGYDTLENGFYANTSLDFA